MTDVKWPRQTDVLSGHSVFGNPRGTDDHVNQKWYKENIIQFEPPYQLFYAGTPIRKVTCHKLVKDSLSRVLLAIWEASGESNETLSRWGANIYGGCYNYRLMRGGSQLSMHAFGCAIDLDPQRNYLGDSTPFFESIHQVRGAFHDEGWTWGGDWDGDNDVRDERRPDGMHWQATQYVK